MTAESVCTLIVNGQTVGSDDKVLVLKTYDLKPFLVAGKNRIELDATSKVWYAGAFFIGLVTTTTGKTVTLMSDDSWDVRVGTDPTVKKSEKVVQGVNGGWWNNCDRLEEMPAPFYHLNTEVPAPCIPWAKTYPEASCACWPSIHAVTSGTPWNWRIAPIGISPFSPATSRRSTTRRPARRRRFTLTTKMRGSRMSPPR